MYNYYNVSKCMYESNVCIHWGGKDKVMAATEKKWHLKYNSLNIFTIKLLDSPSAKNNQPHCKTKHNSMCNDGAIKFKLY